MTETPTRVPGTRASAAAAVAAHGYDEHLGLLVDGRWLGSDGRRGVPVENPATGEVLGEAPVATDDDVDAALAAAHRAFPAWRRTPPEERAAVLHRAAALLRERAEAVAVRMVLENGKPIAEARAEVGFTAGIVDFLAGEALRTPGRVVPRGGDGVRAMVLSEPVGPSVALTPWNYPLTVPARKISAALAAGCTLVLKPAEEAPASGLAMARALVDAGLPDGVLNVVLGDPARTSRRLVTSPLTRAVSFTGSTAVGREVAALAAQDVTRCALELGGHAPVIVLDDVDVAAVARQAVASKLHNNGQSCGSPCRFYVHERVYGAFVEAFAAEAAAVRVGDPLDPATGMGPLAGERRVRALEAVVADATARGARLVTGGRALPGDGWFWEPTVLADVPDDALLMTEEPFGPVAGITPFRDEDDAVARANATPYGLAAYVFTADHARAMRLPSRIEAGMVSVNAFDVGGVDTFFGGVKQSGYGSDGGAEALDVFLARKLVTHA